MRHAVMRTSMTGTYETPQPRVANNNYWVHIEWYINTEFQYNIWSFHSKLVRDEFLSLILATPKEII